MAAGDAMTTDAVASPRRRIAMRRLAPRRRPGYQRRRDAVGLAFALPALGLFGAFAVYPMLRVFYLSFFDYSLTAPAEYVGTANYEFLFGDDRFHTSLMATVFFVVAAYGPAVLLALLIALGLNTRMRGAGVVRLLYFAPVAMSWVAVSVIWRLLLHRDGVINETLGLDVNWLTSSGSARWAVALTAIWKEVGFFVIIFLAGLQNVPKELYEAAALDGAGRWQRFRYVTMPLMKPITAVVAVMAVIRGFQSFSPQVVLTDGSFDTEVVNLFIYKTAFASARMGRASAVAVLMFVLLAIITLIQLRAFRRSDR
ncbi:MAG TPA: sugar ABC transporter permease [Capillimicrobium sp.]|jgi:ABC-type sugar transport system permease subunit